MYERGGGTGRRGEEEHVGERRNDTTCSLQVSVTPYPLTVVTLCHTP